MFTSELAAARAAQVLLMTDTVTVDVLGAPAWDEVAQKSTRARSRIYTGPARVATTTAGMPTLTPAGTVTTPAQAALTVPWDTTEFPPSAEVTVTASTTGNPLVGETVWVDDETTGHLPTARRYVCRHTA